MKKLATIALSLSLASSAAFAQGTTPTDLVQPSPSQTVIIAGGVGTSGLVIGLAGLLLLAALGGGGTGGSSSSSSSSSSSATTN